MNLHWLSSVLDGLARWAWHNSLAASVLVALVLIVQRVFRKWLPGNWVYALWLCVLLRLILPAVPSTAFSIFNIAKLSGNPGAAPAALLHNGEPGIHEESAAENISPVILADHTAGLAPFAPRQWPGLAAYFWIAGALLYLSVVIGHHRKFHGWLKRQEPLTDPRLIDLVGEVKHLLNLQSRIRVFEAAGTPSLFGAFRPHLLLPKFALETLSDAELRHIILHELIHVKRRDVLLNWLVIVVQSLHWFNPLVWFAMRRLRAARELACDAAVLNRLSTGERMAYGATLIKIADCASRISTTTLVPILNRKKQMHRRIAMIANYKPTTRLIAVASAMLVIALGCLTFTRATDKPATAPAAIAEAAPVTAASSNRVEDAQRRIAMLEKWLAREEEAMHTQQRQLDAMKREMAISESEEAGGPSNIAEAIRKLETLRIEATAEYEKVNALYTHLANLNRIDLRKAIATASPDAQLATLQDQFSAAEQKLSVLTEQFAADHPEVRSIRRMLELIQRQIDDRLDGILFGLKARVASSKTGLARLEQELGAMKKSDIETAIAKRPYFQTKRTLDAMQAARDEAYKRLMQAKIDAMIAK